MDCYALPVNPNWAANLRQALQDAIGSRKITQTRVAKLAGVSQAAVSQFINEEGREMEVPMFLAACQLLRLDPYVVFGIPSNQGEGYDAADISSSDAAFEELERAVGKSIVRIVRATHARGQTASARPQRARSRKGYRKNR